MFKEKSINVLQVLLVLVLSVTFSSCSVAEKDAADTPKFTGPWASEFSEHYLEASDDFTRTVLSDGKITEQEFSEMMTKFTDCLAASSITISPYQFDGSYNMQFGDALTSEAAHEISTNCSKKSGEDLIGSLYSWVHRNPAKENEQSILAECLVKRGVVSSGFSERDYSESMTSGKFPFADEKAGNDALQECRLDPLGLQSK